MADRSILFTDFNAPDAEKPGEFQSSYSPRKIEQALERAVKDVQRKLNNARQEFEELKTIQNDRFESNKELSELLTGNPSDYFAAIAPDLQKNKPEEYERLKDLLANNMTEFVKQSTDKINQEKKDIKIKLIEGQSNYSKTSDALGKSRDAALLQQDYYERNPELYAKLYSIQQNAKATDSGKKEDGISSIIIQSEKGELGLAIQKQMDGAPFFFAIRDGKITFPDKQVSEDQMKTLLDFLYVRGIKNFELPPTIEPSIKEAFEKAQAARAEEANKKSQENNKNRPYEQQKEEPAPQNIISGEELPQIISDPSSEQWLKKSDQLTPEKDKEKKKEGYPKAIEEMETWLQKSKGKQKNRSYFRHERSDNLRQFVSLSGWTVFSVYPNSNPNNYKLDGKRDKNGNVNETYSYRIMIKPDGKGGINVGYAMPKGAKVTGDVADKVIGLQKSQGNKYIRFPKGLSDDDTGEFRMACARAGVIPRGININEHHAKRMIETAAGSLSEKDLIEFKYRLAVQMEINMGADTNGRQAGKIAELKGEYFFKPFKDNFDDVLKPGLQNAINGKEADKVIGASRAIQDIYGLYEKASQGTMGDLVSLMKPEDQKAFMESLHKAGITFDEEINVRQMPKEYMSKMFDVMSARHSSEAKKELNDEFVRRREADPDTKSHDITKEMIADESAKLRQMGENLEKDHHVPGLRVPYLGAPHYNYPNDNKKTQTNIPKNHYAASRSGR